MGLIATRSTGIVHLWELTAYAWGWDSVTARSVTMEFVANFQRREALAGDVRRVAQLVRLVSRWSRSRNTAAVWERSDPAITSHWWVVVTDAVWLRDAVLELRASFVLGEVVG